VDICFSIDNENNEVLLLLNSLSITYCVVKKVQSDSKPKQ